MTASMFSGAAAFLLLAHANAAVVGVVPLANGAHLRLHDEARICVNGARFIEYVAVGKPVVQGCWIVSDPVTINAVFLDGDSGSVPIQAVKKPETV